MRFSHSFDDEALIDIERVALWYNRQVPGLGGRFIDEVLRVLGYIVTFPSGYPVAHRTLRRAILCQFPYSIIYEVIQEETVVIVAVLSQRQHSRRLLHRIGEV